jgi:SAM-dependent methyltransferase
MRTKAEVRSLVRLLRLRPGARILDVPCGYGRHAVELARRGFRVTGIDISAALLAQARRAAADLGVEVEFRRGDMRRLGYRRRFDAVLNLFTSFGYFGDAGDLQVLRRFRRALRPARAGEPGGWLVLHLINRDWVMRHYRPGSRSRMGRFVVSEESAFDFATSVVTTRWSARRGRRVFRGTSRLRMYSCHELTRMLKSAGFSRAQAFGDFAGKPLSHDCRWMTLVAQAGR